MSGMVNTRKELEKMEGFNMKFYTIAMNRLLVKCKINTFKMRYTRNTNKKGRGPKRLNIYVPCEEWCKLKEVFERMAQDEKVANLV